MTSDNGQADEDENAMHRMAVSVSKATERCIGDHFAVAHLKLNALTSELGKLRSEIAVLKVDDNGVFKASEKVVVASNYLSDVNRDDGNDFEAFKKHRNENPVIVRDSANRVHEPREKSVIASNYLTRVKDGDNRVIEPSLKETISSKKEEVDKEVKLLHKTGNEHQGSVKDGTNKIFDPVQISAAASNIISSLKDSVDEELEQKSIFSAIFNSIINVIDRLINIILSIFNFNLFK